MTVFDETGMSGPRRRPFGSKRRRKMRHTPFEGVCARPPAASVPPSRDQATLKRSPFVTPPTSASAIGARVAASRIETFVVIVEADRQASAGGIDRDAIGLLARQPAAFGGQAEIRSVAAQLSVTAARDQRAVRREGQTVDIAGVVAIGEQFLARRPVVDANAVVGAEADRHASAVGGEGDAVDHVRQRFRRDGSSPKSRSTSERLSDPSFAYEASHPPAASRRPSGESATA